MRKFWTWITLGLIGAASLQAEFTQPICNYEIAGGYRHDNFEWNFAGGGNSPDVLWKMKWSDVQLYEVYANVNYATCSNYYIRFSGDAGRIWGGHNRDSGYAASGERLEFSRIKAKAKGYVYDATACVGYQWTSNWRRFVGTPVLGYSWRYQYWKSYDANQLKNNPGRLLQTICPDDDDKVCNKCKRRHKHPERCSVRMEDSLPPVGPHRVGDIPGLNVNYDPRWFGPFVGFDWIVSVEVPCLLAFGSVEWHFSEQYRANGRWNHHDRYIQNWSDTSSGHGLLLTLGLDQKICNGWFLGIRAEYRNFQAGKGRHRVDKVIDTREPLPDQKRLDKLFAWMPEVNSKFNRAKWNSYSIEFTIDWRYWCDSI